MNETNDIFEKRLGDHLANHSVDAPADMWDRIATSMAEIDATAKPTITPITIAPRRRQRLGVRRALPYGIAAMLLLGIGLLANRLVNLVPQPAQSELLADAGVLYDPAMTTEPSVEPMPRVEVAPSAVQPLMEQRSVAKPTETLSSFEQPEQSTEKVATIESADNQSSGERTEVADESKPASSKPASAQTPREQFEKRLQEVLASERERRGGRITASLYASNANRMNTQKASPARLAEAGMIKTEVLNSSHGEVIEQSLSSPLSIRHQPETKLNHRVPVTVGVGLQYELTERWALETGVNYTYLHSTGKSEGVFVYTTSQELHYIGVPLSASYKFVDRNRFELYARAGGAVERAVAAKRVQTVGTIDENVSNSTTQEIDCQGVQLSAAVSVGAELKLSQRVGLYAEAGAGYFFDNSQPLSYRTEHPFSLNLQVGARLHFGTK